MKRIYILISKSLFDKIRKYFSICVIIILINQVGCKKESQSINQQPVEEYPRDSVVDVELRGIPKFIKTDYIELSHIYRISKFRSGIGHSYSDNFEFCRSMKHYFQPKNEIDWTTVKIFSPFSGTVVRIYQEWAGTQVMIQSKDYPAFFVIIFHINLSKQLNTNDFISENQQLGTHIGSQTYSDIAFGINTTKGWKLVSYFDLMTDQLFKNYQTKGIVERSSIIISKADRDASPLICNGETFINSGSIENWIILN